MNKSILLFIWFTLHSVLNYSQTSLVKGTVKCQGKNIKYAKILLLKTAHNTLSDTSGNFELNLIKKGNYTLKISSLEFDAYEQKLTIDKDTVNVFIEINPVLININEVVVTGTMKEINRLESLIPVEVYNPTFFKKNPSPSLFESLQNINGIRPQLNCAICNTGDIHMNGLEGPYTLVLIDGMPIISNLGSVYGLSGIPNSLVERIEIVKGPASTLYGSEAIGGLINVITKKTNNASKISFDVMATNQEEFSNDIGFQFKIKQKINVLNGINYFHFQNKLDKNNDKFTDITLQKRVALFQKWSFNRLNNKQFNLGARFVYEDRWGGNVNWEKKFRGSDSVYGESIYTKRFEILGKYEFPSLERYTLSFSYNTHIQDSWYGTTPFDATQHTFFTQLNWDKKIGKNELLTGVTFRNNFYDDSTPITSKNGITEPQITYLPGIFLQNEYSIDSTKKILFGGRVDYSNYHGLIGTPRIAFRWTINSKNSLRLNSGTGYRIVNLFTEDHAALTGARTVEIKKTLEPEKSYNINLNYASNFTLNESLQTNVEITVFYTYFTNRILPDYMSDPNKIIYNNLDGFSENKGITLNLDLVNKSNLKINLGTTIMANTTTKNGITHQQLLSEKVTGTWSVSYKIQPLKLLIDYTGNAYGPMELPLLSPTDPRKQYSPWWSIQNIQLNYYGIKGFEIYSGIKNIFDWTPFKENNPFIIARTHDPFDKKVQLDKNGQIIINKENPYGLSFDPTYVYAPLQGVRLFFGVRYSF